MATYHPLGTQLAAEIKARRTELRLSQAEVARRGFLSSSTLEQWELGRVSKRPQPAKLEDLDRALQWQLGSAAAILTGGTPTPAPAPSEMTLSASEVIELGRAALTMRRTVDRITDDPEVLAVVNRVAALIGGLVLPIAEQEQDKRPTR